MSYETALVRQTCRGARSPFAKMATEMADAVDTLTQELAETTSALDQANADRARLIEEGSDAARGLDEVTRMVRHLVERRAVEYERATRPAGFRCAGCDGPPPEPEDVVLGRILQALEDTPRHYATDTDECGINGPFYAVATRSEARPRRNRRG